MLSAMSARAKQRPSPQPKRFLPARRPYAGRRPEATRPTTPEKPETPAKTLFDEMNIDYDVHLGKL